MHNNNCGWLHFYVGSSASCNRSGKPYEIFISKKTLRYGISWDHINSKGGVDGKPVIANNGIAYNCRLLTGADANPATNRHGMGSEWNSLLYRVHSEIVDTNYGNKQVGDNWVDMSDKELGVNYEVTPNGSFSWCQEHYRATYRVTRGPYSVSDFGGNGPTFASTNGGWRPVLVRSS